MVSNDVPAALGRGTTTTQLPTQFPSARTPAPQYYAAFLSRSSGIAGAADAVEGVVASVSADQAQSARKDVYLYGGGAVFAMLATLAMTWFVVGAVLRPLRRLTAAAHHMSQRRLPQLVDSMRSGGDVTVIEPTPIEVTSEDEIGDLARRSPTSKRWPCRSRRSSRACCARAWASCS